LDPSEVDAIAAYVRAGGGLLVFGEANGPELAAFQDPFGVRFNPDMVYSYDVYSENFSVRLPGDPAYYPYSEDGCDPDLSYDEQRFGPILNGVTSFVYNNGCSLTVDRSKVGFVVTGGCLDMSDFEPVFPPLLAATTLDNGRAAFFGDTDSVAANQQLFTNIVNWLKKPEAATPEGPEFLTVTINLRPWNPHNKINLNARGFVRVAIMSEFGFDAATVDPKTVEFAGAKPVCWKLQKVNRDAMKDLVLVFWIPDLKQDSDNPKGLTCGSETVELTGKTNDGIPILGSDSVHVVQNSYCPKPPANGRCRGHRGK
jgi:hypothetical protein